MKTFAIAIYNSLSGNITLDFFKAKTEFRAMVKASNKFLSDEQRHLDKDAMDDIPRLTKNISRLTNKRELIDYLKDCNMAIACKELNP